MPYNQEVTEKLKSLLTNKRSKIWYSSKLGVTEEEITEMLADIRKTDLHIENLQNTILKFEEDIEKGKAEASYRFNEEIKTLDELIEKGKIDTSVWNIDKYVQNFWGNARDPHWQVKAFLSKKSDKDNYQKSFIEFLSTYKPKATSYIIPQTIDKPEACLIINKQDEHINKYDVNGDNDIADRFINVITKTNIILEQAHLSNYLEKIIYVIGSDEFNSEWTGTTTKGTPQSNIIDYQKGFSKICNYETQMITMLKSYCVNLEIIYVPGNHDEYVGWHIINWLKSYFRENKNITIDDSPKYRKYSKFGNTALMFNHGDAIKAVKLAGIFPIEFKSAWSLCENFMILTGDKHHQISMDINGIRFYQLPSLSKAKSLWDEKQGHVCDKAEITAFMIDKTKGVTSILKQPL